MIIIINIIKKNIQAILIIIAKNKTYHFIEKSCLEF
jgi:hypothetical protein